jgi:ABC-type phosphate transport system auxiliary subunit
VAALLAHLVSGIDRATTDEDFGNMVLSQAQAVVPRIQAYRDRTTSRRDSPPVDHTMIASLQRQIERLLRERRLRLANKLIDKLNLGLQGGRSRLK